MIHEKKQVFSLYFITYSPVSSEKKALRLFLYWISPANPKTLFKQHGSNLFTFSRNIKSAVGFYLFRVPEWPTNYEVQIINIYLVVLSGVSTKYMANILYLNIYESA